MKRRVSRVAIVAVAVALVLLAAPLAVGIRTALFADERGELERAALAAAVRVGPDFAAGDPVELPPASTDGQVGVYDLDLRRRDGSGPAAADAVTRVALAGVVSRGRAGGDLVVAVPVSNSERVVGAVRAAAPVSGVWTRVLLGWLALAGLALLALGVSVLVAVRQARALSRPLESLAGVARSVAAGDLSARAALSGIPEIDDAVRAQNLMVERLAAVLDHERHFAADASHQLRTPLAGLRLSLETALHDPGVEARAALGDALHQSEELQHIVEQVLALARLDALPLQADPEGEVGELIDGLRHRWHSRLADLGRRLDVAVAADAADVRVPLNACGQILDVLVDNARLHGRGTVRVAVRQTMGAVAIEVSDEGSIDGGAELFRRGVSRAGTGIGLVLARDLAESHGGRLTLVSSVPATFGLLIPGSGQV